MRFWRSSAEPVYYVGRPSTAHQLFDCIRGARSGHDICPSHSSAGLCNCPQAEHAYPPARPVSGYELQNRSSGRRLVRTPGQTRTARLAPNTQQGQPRRSGVAAGNGQPSRRSLRQLFRGLYQRPPQKVATVTRGRRPRPAHTSRSANGPPPLAPLETPNPPTPPPPPAPPASQPAGRDESPSANFTSPYIYQTPPTAEQRRAAAGQTNSTSSSRNSSLDRRSNASSFSDRPERTPGGMRGAPERSRRSSSALPPQSVEPPKGSHRRSSGPSRQQHGNTGPTVPPVVVLPPTAQIVPGQPTPGGGMPGRSNPHAHRSAAVPPELSYPSAPGSRLMLPGSSMPQPQPQPQPPPPPPPPPPPSPPRAHPNARGTFPPNYGRVVPGRGPEPEPGHGEYLHPHTNNRPRPSGRQSGGRNNPHNIATSPFPPPSGSPGRYQMDNATQMQGPSFGQTVGGLIDRVSTAVQNFSPFPPPPGSSTQAAPFHDIYYER